MFDPKLAIGQVLSNSEIVALFKCSNSGGMRRSLTTNTLVLVSDYTKGLYHDKWIGGELHYTGTGKVGDQDLDHGQNETLAKSAYNGVDVHLFEVIDPGEYIYCGRVALVGKPYMDTQPDENHEIRNVWMFPIRPIPDNQVRKPAMYVFADMDDYNAHKLTVDQEYAKSLETKKKGDGNTIPPSPTSEASKPEPKQAAVPPELLGKRVKHRPLGNQEFFGVGVIQEIGKGTITVDFDLVGKKTLVYETCIKHNLLEFI